MPANFIGVRRDAIPGRHIGLDLWELAALGVLQGVLEWLPISSSGQVAMAIRSMAGLPIGESLGVAMALHLGTGLSVIALLRAELASAAKEAVHGRLHPAVLVALVPLLTGAPLALLVRSFVAAAPEDMVNVMMGLGLVVTGLLLHAAWHSRRGISEPYPLLTDLAALGLIQAVAMIPGVSRSGLVIAYLLLRGYSAHTSVRASMLSGMAAALSTGAYHAAWLGSRLGVTGAELLTGVAAAFLGGTLSAKFMLSISTRVGARALAVALGATFLAVGILGSI